MSFLHSEVNLVSGEAVIVELSAAANVRVMDTVNYQRYARQQSHRYYGGLVTRSPVAIKPPHGGHWHVAIDLGGARGRVRAAIRVE